MQSNGGGRRSAAVLLLCTLTSGLSAAVCATAEEPAVSNSAERYGIDPVMLGAMPAESRALFKEVLGRPDIMHGEMAGLYPSGGRSSTRTDLKCTQPACADLPATQLAQLGRCGGPR